MVSSYVVRLVREYLHEGRFVGEIEDVATGRIRPVRNVDELTAAIRESADGDLAPIGPEQP